ncbi:MAG: FAD-dependent oxidoreductase, partial [Patescibacteria group bacterium]|nr:FAD-dependent oxidoreductase [Patescibacteria group bacterium]
VSSSWMRERYFWDFLWDEESGRMLEDALTLSGVELAHSLQVLEVLGGSKVEGVKLSDGSEIPCDAFIVGIGVKYPLEWLAASGLQTGRGIIADEFLQTSLPDVWTAGDVAEYQDAIIGERVQLGNWVNAQAQGRVAGANMAGEKQAFRFVSFYTASGLGIAIAFVGSVAVVPGREVLHRGSPSIGRYGRLIVRGDRIVGATLLNRTAELMAIVKLIENRIPISDKHIQLSDPDFDLKEFIK